MKIAATIARSLQADIQAGLRDLGLAAATGTRDAGRGLKTELRRQVTSAGLGQRLGISWRDKTANAPRKGTDGKRIRPGTFPEHRFGPLRFVPRRNGPSLLVVEGVRAFVSRKTGELRGFRRASDRARRTGAGYRRDVSAGAAGEAAEASMSPERQSVGRDSSQC